MRCGIALQNWIAVALRHFNRTFDGALIGLFDGELLGREDGEILGLFVGGVDGDCSIKCSNKKYYRKN